MFRKLVVARYLAAIVLAITCSPLAIPQQVVYNIAPKQPEESHCMAWVVHNESRGEPLKGSRAVLDVVLKRMQDSGKKACEVIAEPKQFSGYKKRYVHEVSEEALQRFIAVAAMRPVTTKCKYFHAKRVSPAWATKMTKCFQIGNHIFYKEKQNGSDPRHRKSR